MVATGGVVVVEHDDVGATHLLTVQLQPLRLLAGLASAVCVASCGDADAPEVVGVLLAFDAGDDPTVSNCLFDLVNAVQDLGVDPRRPRLPSAATIRLLQPEPRLPA